MTRAADHPDWPAFIATIVANPDDDTARLVAADFLEENGDSDRAAFIRIQVQLARLEATGQSKSLEADHLRAKERAFLGPLALYKGFWAAEECTELVRMGNRGGGRNPLEATAVEGADRVTFRRGFIEVVRCPAEEWERHGEAVRRRNPIRDVTLTNCDQMSREQWYAAMAGLTGLKSLTLLDGDPGLAVWLESWLPGTEVTEVMI